MADGKKLHEFNIHQFSAGQDRVSVSLNDHIGRCAIPRIELDQTADSQYDGHGLKRNDLAVDQVETHRPQGTTVFGDNLDDGYVAHTTNFTDLADLAS